MTVTTTPPSSPLSVVLRLPKVVLCEVWPVHFQGRGFARLLICSSSEPSAGVCPKCVEQVLDDGCLDRSVVP